MLASDLARIRRAFRPAQPALRFRREGEAHAIFAEHDFARGKRATLAKLVLSPAWRFWRGYVLRGGFLDGWHGLVYAYVRANYVRQKTVMLWLLQNGQPVTTSNP